MNASCCVDPSKLKPETVEKSIESQQNLSVLVRRSTTASVVRQGYFSRTFEITSTHTKATKTKLDQEIVVTRPCSALTHQDQAPGGAIHTHNEQTCTPNRTGSSQTGRLYGSEANPDARRQLLNSSGTQTSSSSSSSETSNTSKGCRARSYERRARSYHS